MQMRGAAALMLGAWVVVAAGGCERSARTPGKAGSGMNGGSNAGSGGSLEQQQRTQGGGDGGQPMVVLLPDGHDEVRIRVELARTVPEQTQGLMFRTQMDADAGMLFLFDRDEVHTFWMKNTLIPLDMVFITADGRVAGVVANTEPETLTGRGIGTPSRHVLELVGGLAAARGIGPGTRVRYVNIPGL